jgi:hypothetical protein
MYEGSCWFLTSEGRSYQMTFFMYLRFGYEGTCVVILHTFQKHCQKKVVKQQDAIYSVKIIQAATP